MSIPCLILSSPQLRSRRRGVRIPVVATFRSGAELPRISRRSGPLAILRSRALDGALRAHSGIVKVGDKPRLLVVTGLEKASEVKLLTRRDDLSNDENCLATWADPRFIKVKP